MWQYTLDVADLIAKIAQTVFAGFGVWLAWKIFLKEENQEAVTIAEVATPNATVPDLKLFETSKQTTWLKKTANGVECHIDERRTGKHGGHKWTLAPAQIRQLLDGGDVHVNTGYKLRTGLISIGSHSNWLYSKALHPDPGRLKHQLIELLKAASLQSGD